jgi:hypothetical protein
MTLGSAISAKVSAYGATPQKLGDYFRLTLPPQRPYDEAGSGEGSAMRYLFLLIFLAIIVFSACACTSGGDDDQADDDIDDDSDDDTTDDDANNDDDSQSEDEQRIIYGYYTESYVDPYGRWWDADLSIYHFNGVSWDTPVDEEDGFLAADIWGASADQVFVVGGNTNYRAFVYHYNGTQWRLRTLAESISPFIYVGSLYSIFGSSPTDLYALGILINAWDYDAGRIIMHYDGQDWSTSYIPDESIDLFDIWCAPSGECFVVGGWFHDGGYRGYLIFQNDSGKWAETKYVNPQNQVCSLKAVWGAAADDVFAAGDCWDTTEDPEFLYRALVLHYDGNEWQEMDTSGMENLTVEDISGASGQEVYLAADTDVDYGASSPRIYFFDGNNWSEQQFVSEAIKDHGLIRSIWATSSSELYIVDGYLDIYDHHAGTIQTMESPPLTRVWAQAAE